MRKLLLVIVAALFALAYAQEQEAPYVKYAEPLRFAYGTEMLGIQLAGLAAASSDVQADAEEDGGGTLFADSDFLGLFKGSLQAKDADLYSQLEQALTAADSALKGGSGVDTAVKNAQSLLKQARDALVPTSAQQDLVFQATLIPKLLLTEGGVSDGYEDATDGEAGGYVVAWAGAQRVEELWKALEPELDSSKTEAITSVEDALKELHELVPSVTEPDVLRDEDDFESASRALSLGLRGALGVTLYPHDLAHAVPLLNAQGTAACTDAKAGKLQIAAEGVAAADNTYNTYFEDALSVIAADTGDKLDTLLGDQFPDALQKGDSGAIQASCSQFSNLVQAVKGAIQ